MTYLDAVLKINQRFANGNPTSLDYVYDAMCKWHEKEHSGSLGDCTHSVCRTYRQEIVVEETLAEMERS